MARKKNAPLTYAPLIFNVYKPVGMTSFEVVSHFKRNLAPGFGKIGHFGTLDPFAEGVLLIGVAGASRLTQIVNDCLPKTYEATGLVGIKTDSADHTGVVVARDEEVAQNDFVQLGAKELDHVFNEYFKGDYWQRAQAFSAAKHEGKPLYEYARAGIMIEKEALLRTIYKIEVQHFELPHLKFVCEVSSGTYVRVLFEDMMALFHTLGSLQELKRLAVGHLHVLDSLHPNDWPLKGEHPQGGAYDLSKYATPMDQVLKLRAAILTAEQVKRYQSGLFPCENEVVWEEAPGLNIAAHHLVWIYREEGRQLIGLASWDAQGQTRPKVIFNLPGEVTGA